MKLPNFNNPFDVEEFKNRLMINSGLPGPRANLKVVNNFDSLVNDSDKSIQLYEFLKDIWQVESNGNEPTTLLNMSGLIGLSHYYFEMEHRSEVIKILVSAMNDSRWRIREIIQEAFKTIAYIDYNQLILLFETFNNPTPLEVRAIITTLAHPELLKTEYQINYALKKLQESFDYFLTIEKTTNSKDESLVSLTKGLSFAPSVIIAASPKNGFSILKNYINHSKYLNKIINENLKKNRLVKKYPTECNELTAMINMYILKR